MGLKLAGEQSAPWWTEPPQAPVPLNGQDLNNCGNIALAAGKTLTPSTRLVPRVSGRYYAGPQITRQAAGDTALGPNAMKFIPFIVDAASETYDRITINVSTLGGAGAKVRLSLYNDSNGVPGSLVLDAGEVDVTATGIKEIAISQTLNRGIYWLATLCNDGTVRIMHNDRPATMEQVGGLGFYDLHGVSASQTYGAAPNPAPSVSMTDYREVIVVLRKA